MAEDSHCTTMSQTALVAPKVAALTPRPGQAEIEASPTPAPRASRITETAAAAKPPPMMAAQETADSLPGSMADTGTASSGTVAIIARLSSAPEQQYQDDDGDRDTEKPKQNTTA